MHCKSCITNLNLANNEYAEGNETSFLLTFDKNCVSNCPSYTYKFPPNNTCLKECPNNYETNQEQNECIKKSMDKTT